MTESLELLICTINEGITRVPDILLPERQDVRYLISWQQTDTVSVEVPACLQSRPDVTITTLQGRGLARNRNNALKHATASILILADDDTRYRPEYLDRVLESFRRYPKADFICFQAIDFDGKPLKHYAAEPFTYAARPRGTYFSSCEIAFRRSSRLPLFDERFGLGSRYLACGEEEVFLHEAYRSGLKIIFLPTTVVETNAATTGKRFQTNAAVRRSKGAVLYLLHGATGARMRCLRKAMSYTQFPLSKRLKYFNDMNQGIRYIQHGHL